MWHSIGVREILACYDSPIFGHLILLRKSIETHLCRQTLEKVGLGKIVLRSPLAPPPPLHRISAFAGAYPLLVSWVICAEKIPLEFRNDFRAACEPVARIWHKGNDPIEHRPIAIIVLDVDLQEIQRHQLAWYLLWTFCSPYWMCCC